MFPGLEIVVYDDSKCCVNEADVIVTATNSSVPLFGANDLKKSFVHLNGTTRNSQA